MWLINKYVLISNHQLTLVLYNYRGMINNILYLRGLWKNIFFVCIELDVGIQFLKLKVSTEKVFLIYSTYLFNVGNQNTVISHFLFFVYHYGHKKIFWFSYSWKSHIKLSMCKNWFWQVQSCNLKFLTLWLIDSYGECHFDWELSSDNLKGIISKIWKSIWIRDNFIRPVVIAKMSLLDAYPLGIVAHGIGECRIH